MPKGSFQNGNQSEVSGESYTMKPPSMVAPETQRVRNVLADLCCGSSLPARSASGDGDPPFLRLLITLPTACSRLGRRARPSRPGIRMQRTRRQGGAQRAAADGEYAEIDRGTARE